MRFVVCGLMAMFALVAPAAALDFTFSFSGSDGTVPGIVTGEILGLADNTAHQSAADIIIDSYPSAALGLGPGTIDTNSGGIIHYTDSFDVTSGQVTAANLFFAVASPGFEFALNYQLQGGVSFLTNDGGNLDVHTGGGLAADNIQPSFGTPEPSALVLFTAGALGLLAAARRRNA